MPRDVGPSDEARGETIVAVHDAAGRVICERCLMADTPGLRLRGLLGRRRLPAGEGIWIRPAASVHTLGMRFAIDVVFLDRDGAVLAVVAALAPWRAASRRRARSVLELAAGEASRRSVAVGVRLAARAEGP